jgi:hypothetical protein
MLLFTTQTGLKLKRPVGSLAHGALHAPGLIVGLGRESRFPHGPRLGPVIVSRPSASNGHAWNLAEQNRVNALARTLGFIRSSSPHAAPQLAPTAPPRPLSLAHAPADGWTRRHRAAPRQSPTHAPQRASERSRPSVDEQRGGGWRRRRPSHRRARPPMGGRTAVERLLGRALPARPWRVSSL